MFDEARLEKIKNLIEKFDDALLALSSGESSYSLDTGQTRINVTATNLTEVRKARQSLLNEYSELHIRIYGCGVSIGRPG